MEYEPKDLPSLKKIDEQIPAIKTILKINKLLSLVGIGSKKIKALETQFAEILKQKEELENYPTKFNRYFSNDGWIVHDLLDFEIVKKAVDLYDEGRVQEAKKLIMDYYSPKEMDQRLLYLRHVHEFQTRIKFIEFALEDYKAGRYYSCVPILIMMIDGIVSDTIQKGFHAHNVDLNVWDSLTATDTGIEVVKNIFQSPRKKTSLAEITLPFRHGILHGRDLGYDNYEVAAKCWAFLFVIRDWIISKRTEEDRIKKYQEENKKVTWKELVEQINELDKTKKALNTWEPRKITQEYINKINSESSVEKDSPEEMVVNFLDYWNNKNFGMMAKLYSEFYTDNYKKFAGDIRSEYDHQKLINYNIIQINDEAPSITEIYLMATIEQDDIEERKIKFRCIYEMGKHETVPRNLKTGQWKVITANH